MPVTPPEGADVDAVAGAGTGIVGVATAAAGVGAPPATAVFAFQASDVTVQTPRLNNTLGALVAAGIFSILNFASGVVVVPSGIEVRQVDLALELQMLAFHETSRIAGVANS